MTSFSHHLSKIQITIHVLCLQGCNLLYVSVSRNPCLQVFSFLFSFLFFLSCLSLNFLAFIWLLRWAKTYPLPPILWIIHHIKLFLPYRWCYLFLTFFVFLAYFEMFLLCEVFLFLEMWSWESKVTNLTDCSVTQCYTLLFCPFEYEHRCILTALSCHHK